MGARKTTHTGPPPTREDIETRLRDGGLIPIWWSNAPNDTYGRHQHPYDKVLYCQQGHIVFHTDDGDIELGPGDRLDIDANTEHAASVGPEGCTCAEGHL